MDNVINELIADPKTEIQHGPYIFKVLEDEVYYTMNWPNRREYIWYKHNQLPEDYNLI